MKTWEMYKIALENPEAKFKRTDMNDAVYGFIGSVLVYGDNGKVAAQVPGPHENWELEPQEVTWQEAIQAWIGGKEIYCEHNKETYYYASGDLLVDGKGRSIMREELKFGKWYVK